MATSSAPPRAKHGKPLHVSEALLRHSTKLHDVNRGYKSPTCRGRKCLGCASDPPLLSASVVRDMETSFYKLNPSALTDEKLRAKSTKKKDVVGRPRKPKEPKDGPEDGSKAKKSKK